MYYICKGACKVCNCCSNVPLAGGKAVKFTQNYCNSTLIQSGYMGELSSTAIIIIAAVCGFFVLAFFVASVIGIVCCSMYYCCPKK